jgi:hypothetical protein
MPSCGRRFFLGVFALCPALFAATAEISFTGEQDGYFESGQYIATGTITVKRGKTLTFAPGSVVRFKQFAGIIVEGNLKCVGWESQPVIFTSDNNRLKDGDAQYKIPAPFDWNGIQVADSIASLDLENVRITYSTYGLDIKSSASQVRLKGVVFAENGRGGITIDDKQLGVIDNEDFSFVQPPVDSVATPRKVSAKPMAQPKPHKPMDWRFPVRLSLGAIAIAGVAAGFIEDSQAKKYQDAYVKDADPLITDADRKKRDDAKNLRTLGYAIGIAAACGFTLTFFF